MRLIEFEPRLSELLKVRADRLGADPSSVRASSSAVEREAWAEAALAWTAALTPG